MGYTDNYERDEYGIIAFWLRNDYDHGRFLDREISHYETELARANLNNIKRLGKIWQKAEAKTGDIGTLIDEAQLLQVNSIVCWPIQWIDLYIAMLLYQHQYHF